MDELKIADRTFKSRLIMGSARYPNPQSMLDSLEAGGAEIITVAIRRVKFNDPDEENVLNLIDRRKYSILPNTAGCYTAKEAVLTAHLAREALGTHWIKLEVIGDEETLFPDVPGGRSPVA